MVGGDAAVLPLTASAVQDDWQLLVAVAALLEEVNTLPLAQQSQLQQPGTVLQVCAPTSSPPRLTSSH